MAPLYLPACTISIVAAYSGIEPLCLLATTTILSMSKQKKNIIRKGFLELQNVLHCFFNGFIRIGEILLQYLFRDHNIKLYFVKSNWNHQFLRKFYYFFFYNYLATISIMCLKHWSYQRPFFFLKIMLHKQRKFPIISYVPNFNPIHKYV